MSPALSLPRAVLGTALALASLTSCGDPSPKELAGGRTAAELLSAARKALLNAKAVHITGTLDMPGGPVKVDAHIVGDKGKVTLVSGGDRQITNTAIRVGSRSFYKDSVSGDGFWEEDPGVPPPAYTTHHHWARYLPMENTVSLGKAVTVAGDPALRLKDASGTTVVIAGGDRPRPLRIKLVERQVAGQIAGTRSVTLTYGDEISINPPKIG